jgi:hypothetical protein
MVAAEYKAVSEPTISPRRFPLNVSEGVTNWSSDCALSSEPNNERHMKKQMAIRDLMTIQINISRIANSVLFRRITAFIFNIKNTN